ncbi:putative transcription factor ILR3 [Iris pallida]|uniref:Transcription factor ILR3 n=1 Tax=Iris pallida TaxID=29817 RepID=A0AAX6G877_IRIPA|nr:putative transcription factor ILR3 [Iris pallida]
MAKFYVNCLLMQGKHELLLECIKEDLGFEDEMPIAAYIIYRCLLDWRALEDDMTSIFDFTVEAIDNTGLYS